MATMTKTLADALWPFKIRVNQLNLDWVATANEIKLKISEGLPPDWYKHVPLHMAPSGELLMPEDIANVAMVYLSSNKLNGMVIPVGQVPMTVRLNGNQKEFIDAIKDTKLEEKCVEENDEPVESVNQAARTSFKAFFQKLWDHRSGRSAKDSNAPAALTSSLSPRSSN